MSARKQNIVTDVKEVNYELLVNTRSREVQPHASYDAMPPHEPSQADDLRA